MKDKLKLFGYLIPIIALAFSLSLLRPDTKANEATDIYRSVSPGATGAIATGGGANNFNITGSVIRFASKTRVNK